MNLSAKFNALLAVLLSAGFLQTALAGERNGKTKYGAAIRPLESPPDGDRIMQKGHTVYLLVLAWPTDGQLVVENLPDHPQLACLLANNESPVFESLGQNISIALPGSRPDKTDTIIVSKTTQTSIASQ